MTQLLIQGTHGADDPEQANLPFIMANVAVTADQEAVVFLTSDAVWLATEGGGDDVSFGGHPSVAEMVEAFVGNGGEIWACGACTGPRDIAEYQLVPGAKIVTAANVTEALVGGAKTLAF